MSFIRFSPTSLRNRVLILTLSGFLLIAVTLTVLIISYLRNESAKLLVNQQQSMISMVVEQMDSALNKRVKYLEQFALTLKNKQGLISNASIQTALNNESYLHSMFNGGLVVLNRQGISIVDYPIVPNRTGINFANRPHMKAVNKTRQTVITRPLIGKGLNTPLFAINTPILSRSGDLLGYIFGVNVLAKDNLLKEISRQAFSDEGQMLIIDPNLEIYVTESKQSAALQKYNKTEVCQCIKEVLAGKPSGISRDREGDQIIYTSDRIEQMGWIVIRTYPLKLAMQTTNDLILTITIITILCILLMAGLIAYLLKQQLTPLRDASETIMAMAQGQQSDRLLKVSQQDEVGQLIQAFNQLHTSRQRYEQALEESEQRYRLTMEATGTGIWSWNLGTDRISWNSQCYQMLGYEDKEFELNREGFRKLLHPDDQVDFFISFMPQMLNNTSSEIEFRLRTKQGNWLWIQSRGKPITFNRENRPLSIAGTHVNIDKQKQTEQLRLAAAAFETNDAIMIVDSESKIVKVNSAFSQITGYSQEDAIGNTPSLLRSEVHNETFYNELWDSLNQTGQWQGEIWNRRKNGEVYVAWLNINTLLNDDHSVYQRVAVFSDITEKKRSEELIWKQANFDPLTGLPNRRMFMDRLTQEIRLAARSKTSLALLFLDLDRFKEVNDTLGHNIGDKLLIEVAKRFSELVRSSDTIARLGGDEFTLILPQIESNSQIELVAEKILDVLKQPFEINHQQLFISASIGATLYPQDADNADQLIQNADQAMYDAKDSGRNTMHYFTRQMQEQAVTRVNLVKQLREAISNKEFELRYQPIVDLQSMAVCRAEALIRWNHPQRGLVYPDQFIPEAEESGLVLEIGEWVFTEALQQVKAWRNTLSPDFQISVNTSPAHFDTSSAHNYTPERWISLINSAGVCGSAINIEITEHLLMETTVETKQQLLKLRDANIQVALDDFGTGYSSLAYLNQLDIDYLKIDRSFVQNLQPDSNDLVLCNAIIVMAHTLGLKVIAEGIETEQQHQLLRNAACDYGQGFFYAKALTADAFYQWHQDFQTRDKLCEPEH